MAAAGESTTKGAACRASSGVMTMSSAARSGAWEGVAAPADVPRFAALYRSHFGFTWSCLRRLGVPAAGIDDAAQELWVTAHRRLDQLHDARAARSWLYGIARRVASHHRRAEHRHRRKLEAVTHTRARTGAESTRESALIVEAILDTLEPRVREAFVLSELEGWTAPEIAKATGANANTIYWRVRVARQELASQLAAANDDTKVDSAVIQLRDATRPPRGAAKHCWALLVPLLESSSLLGGALSSLGALKIATLAIVAAVATVGAIEIGARTPERASPVAPAIASEIASAAVPVVIPEPPEPAPMRATAAVATPSPTEVPIQRPAARTLETTPPAATPTPASAATVPAGPADVQLLADARRAMSERRFARARELLAEHAERFPNSALADIREGVRVQTLCREGDVEAARATAARIVERWPKSAIAKRASELCPAK
jgi:RNA polymerase sigma-70 factor (ECF subfamily)